MRSGLRKHWDDLYEWVEKKYRGAEYRKKARVRNKRLNGGYDCRKEYNEIVVPYWKKYGKKPKILWYKNYSAESKQVDPRYIPDDMWFEDILPYFSNIQFRRFGEDKCQHGIWFPDAKRPYTVCANVAGVFYDNEYNIITKEEAAKRCVEYKRFLIKPSIDSGEGRLIKFYDDQDLTVDGMLKAFDEMGCNFLAQEVLRQHPVLESLNPTSLNTVRIITLLFKGKVHVLSSVVRVGGEGARVDNTGAGGYCCGIKDDGFLKASAVTRKSSWYDKTSTGISFASVQVPSYDKAIAFVKELHQRLAHFKIIGWDIGIDVEGEPVLIEFNTNPGQNQYACGPCFGDITEEVLQDVFIDKTLKNAKN